MAKQARKNTVREHEGSPLDQTRFYIEVVRGGMPFAAEQLEMILFIIKHSGKKVRRFLDIGCGNGIMSGALFTEHPKAEAVLVDNDPQMLKEAAEQLKEFSGNIELINEDLSSSNWVAAVAHKARYDLVVSGYTLAFLGKEERKRVLRDVYALLSPGGIFLAVDIGLSKSPWLYELSLDQGIDSICDFAKRRGLDIPRKKVEKASLEAMDKTKYNKITIYQQCEDLKKAGFSEVNYYFKFFDTALYGGIRPKESMFSRIMSLLRNG